MNGKLFILLLTAIFLATPPKGNVTLADVGVLKDTTDFSSGDYATYYLTIADTSKNYFVLDREMYALSESIGVPVDTMNRYYNRKKDGIIVSESDDDEMYRGEYYPRRFTGNSLSLEYYSVYSDRSTKKNIALVAGIYETRNQADTALAILRNYCRHCFEIKATVFIGCMH